MRAVKLRRWIRRFKRWRAGISANSSVIIAACSMVIALVATGLSAYSAYLMREHDRRSVRPKLVISFTYDDTGAGWVSGNSGLGPARLRGFRILINGIKQEPPKSPTEFSDLIIDGLHLPAGKYEFLNPAVDQMFTPDNTLRWFWVDSPSIGQTLKSEYKTITIEFCYCSIYDECWFGWSGIALSIRDDACSAFSREPRSNWWQG
jgi:hypothetical protein